MARYAVGARAAGAGSATLPLGSLYAGAAVNMHIREIGVFNTTAVAVAVGLCRMSTAGTQGSALTEQPIDALAVASTCQGFNTHTSTGPTLVDLGIRASLGAGIGSGVIWTFGDVGMTTTVGTGNGIGIYIPTGTGQVCDWYIIWDE